jgi:membrane dipeptidase
MRFFDAHYDTILKVVQEGADFATGHNTHVTLPGMVEAGIGAQVFAVWALESRLGAQVDESAMRMVDAVAALCSEHPDQLVLARSFAEIEQAFSPEGSIAVIVSLEGADPLKGDPSTLKRFFDKEESSDGLSAGPAVPCGLSGAKGP